MGSLDELSRRTEWVAAQQGVSVVCGGSVAELTRVLGRLQGVRTLVLANSGVKSVYCEQFAGLAQSSVAEVDYGCGCYLLENDPGWFDQFEFVVLAQFQSNCCLLFTSLLVNTRRLQSTKVIVPLLCSEHEMDATAKYFRKFGYTCTSVKLKDAPPTEVYYSVAGEPSDVTSTLQTIFATTENASVLVVASGEHQAKQLKLRFRDWEFTNYILSEERVKSTCNNIVIKSGLEDGLMDSGVKAFDFVIDSGKREAVQKDLNGFDKLVDRNIYKEEVHQLCWVGKKVFIGLPESEVKPATLEVTPQFLIYVLNNGIRLNEFKYLKSVDIDTLRRSISYLYYLELAEIKAGDDIKLTSRARNLAKHEIFSDKLFYLSLSLVKSVELGCSNEILKIISVLANVNINELSMMLHTGSSGGCSEFLEVVNLFNEKRKLGKHFKKVASTYNKLLERQFQLGRYKKGEFSEKAVLRSLLFGFQVNLVKLVEARQISKQITELIVQPVFGFSQPDYSYSMKCRVSFGGADRRGFHDDVNSRNEFQKNDVLIFYSYELKSPNGEPGDETVWYWLDLVNKVPKETIGDLKLFKLAAP